MRSDKEWNKIMWKRRFSMLVSFTLLLGGWTIIYYGTKYDNEI